MSTGNDMSTGNHIASRLAGHVCRTRFEDFPAATLNKAKLHILDTLGCGIAGSTSVETRLVAKGLGLLGDAGGSVAWGLQARLCARSAAFINGISAHAFELDDSGGCDHSGAVVLPAALAILPQLPHPVSGQTFLRSILMGYEVGRRVLEATGGYEAHNGVGWHSTGTCGVFGAAAAVGVLLGLDEAQLASALGIASSYAGGTWGFIHDGSQTKKLHAGRAAEGGISAALLAAASFKGPPGIFDADQWGSFQKTFTPGLGDEALLVADFGQNWRLDRCSIKPYATCRGTHAAIDALKILLARHHLGPTDIAGLEADMSGFQFGMCGGKSLRSRADAQMSLPYALAAQMQFGKVGLSELEPAAWSASAIPAWLDRITVRPAPRMQDEDEPIITLVTRDGQRFSETVPFPFGSPGNPLPDDQLIAKFIDLSSSVLPAAQLSKLQDAAMGLEDLADVGFLPDLMH